MSKTLMCLHKSKKISSSYYQITISSFKDILSWNALLLNPKIKHKRFTSIKSPSKHNKTREQYGLKKQKNTFEYFSYSSKAYLVLFSTYFFCSTNKSFYIKRLKKESEW